VFWKKAKELSLMDTRKTQITRHLLEHRGEIIGFIRAIVRDPHKTEDLFQEVAMIVLEKAEAEVEIHQFLPWVKEVARRKVKEFYRKQKSLGEIPMPTEEMVSLVEDVWNDSPSESESIRRKRDAMSHCLDQLTQSIRELLIYRFADGLAYEDLAQQSGKSEIAVRRAVARARETVFDCAQKFLRRTGDRT
jgi:RNA polymerase sigma-70 factor, ECF subfamily